MSILYDARGNEITGGLVDQIVGIPITDARPQTASLGVVNAEALVDLNGQAVVQVDLRTAAFVGTVVFEATIDGTNYWAVVGLNQQTQQFESFVTGAGAVAKNLYFNATGFKRFRVRCSAYTSGALTVAARGTRADFAIVQIPLPTPLCVTGTAAVNTGVTITLPAAVGLFHYITAIEITKFYSVLGVAAAAPVIVTSTNLTSNPAFSFDQPATPQGQATTRFMSFPSPLKSTVLNTATTLVAPVQLQTIWRLNVWYYLGA